MRRKRNGGEKKVARGTRARGPIRSETEREMIKDRDEHNLLRREEGISTANNHQRETCLSPLFIRDRAGRGTFSTSALPRHSPACAFHALISGFAILILKHTHAQTFLPSNYTEKYGFYTFPWIVIVIAAAAKTALRWLSCRGLSRQRKKEAAKERKTATSIMKGRRLGEENKSRS